MALELNNPIDIYQKIIQELGRIVSSLNSKSNDETLNQAQEEAQNTLNNYRLHLQEKLAELERNAEWNTFTIAFYGETNAGKSTIIETLRILLKEPTKLANQQAFRSLQKKYDLNEENIQQQKLAIEKIDAFINELTQQLDATLKQHEQLQNDTLSKIHRLQVLIAENKKTASLWRKLLNLFRKTAEENELTLTEKKLPGIVISRDQATFLLAAQQTETNKSKHDLIQQQQKITTNQEDLLSELERYADGEIIGDGRADFTRQTHRYNFELDGQPFALLDVPGIEGKEEMVCNEIGRAVQTAHAVFYVTNQPAPPQTGDEQRKGTLEKIKGHLGSQTEVWTIYNKKITNPKQSLTNRELTSDDENTSLTNLNEIMRDQLGTHYNEVISLSALPAFLASSDHFAPNSQNAKRRSKILTDFSSTELLEKSRVNAFLQLLNDQLICSSKEKITRANFNKANEALSQSVETMEKTLQNFLEYSDNLQSSVENTQAQVMKSFKALKQRLNTCGEKLIDEFRSIAGKEMYDIIENDISNDDFKKKLNDIIDAKKNILQDQLSSAMSKHFERFQKDIEDILNRFEEQARELTDIYAKLNNAQLNEKLNLTFNLDTGVKIGSLLLTLGGAILTILGTGGWVLVIGLAGLIFSFAKSILSAFSKDFKKSQQRKNTDENLRKITEQLRKSFRENLESAMPEMQLKIKVIEQVIETPAKQAVVQAQLFSKSITEFKNLSLQIETAGKSK